jgi:hypothetical protein
VPDAFAVQTFNANNDVFSPDNVFGAGMRPGVSRITSRLLTGCQASSSAK